MNLEIISSIERAVKLGGPVNIEQVSENWNRCRAESGPAKDLIQTHLMHS